MFNSKQSFSHQGQNEQFRITYLKRGDLRVGSSWKMYRIFIYPILFGRIWHNSHSFPSFCQIFWRLLVLLKTPNFVFAKHCVAWFVYSFGSNCTLLPFLFLLPLWYFALFTIFKMLSHHSFGSLVLWRKQITLSMKNVLL